MAKPNARQETEGSLLGTITHHTSSLGMKVRRDTAIVVVGIFGSSGGGCSLRLALALLEHYFASAKKTLEASIGYCMPNLLALCLFMALLEQFFLGGES
jgi:hypothetical protein